MPEKDIETVYAVGKSRCINSDGTTEFILKRLFRKEKHAKKHAQSLTNKYYKKKPYLSPYITRAIKIFQ